MLTRRSLLQALMALIFWPFKKSVTKEIAVRAAPVGDAAFDFAVHNNPPTVWINPDGKFELISGFRRCEALMNLAKEEGNDVYIQDAE